MPSPSPAVSAEEVQALRMQIAAMQAGAVTSHKQLADTMETSSGWQRKTSELESAAVAQNRLYTKLLTVRYEFISAAALVAISFNSVGVTASARGTGDVGCSG